MHFKKTYKSKREVAALSKRTTSGNEDTPEDECIGDPEEEELEDADSDIVEYAISGGQGYKKKKFTFSETHPGKQFSHLAELKQFIIPKMYIPEGMLCRLEELKHNDANIGAETRNLREK